jgi:hypothetical protein
MLISYHGVVENGKVRLRDTVVLPEGAEVIVVTQQPLSLEEQERRLAALLPEEWPRSFEAVRRAWDESEPAELEGETLSDDELNAIVHLARTESND